MGKYSPVCFMIVDRETHLASNLGFAPTCKATLKLSYPDLPEEVYQRPDVIQMMDEVDNQTGSVYVLEPQEGQPLVANSTLDKLLKEIEQ